MGAEGDKVTEPADTKASEKVTVDAESAQVALMKRGEERFAKRLEKELGIPFNVDDIKDALKKRADAAEASKTAEQKAAEAKALLESSSKENERLKSIISQQAEAKMKALKSQELRDMVVAAAGEDPLAQMDFMSKPQFSALETKLGGTGVSLSGVAGNADVVSSGADTLKAGKELYRRAKAGDHMAEVEFIKWQNQHNDIARQAMLP